MIFCAQEHHSASHRLSVFPEDRPPLVYVQSRCQPLILEDASQRESESTVSAAVNVSRNTHLIVYFLDLSIRGINSLAPRNQTVIPEFILLGLTNDPELQPIIFSLFLMVYLVTLLGNLLMVWAVISDSHLHTPMYFFLSHLSFTDICVSTSTIPKMLVNILTQNQTITFTGCLSQIFFVLFFCAFENFLLAAMSYDRYVAICHPLRYTVIMNPCFCGLLMLLSLLASLMLALLHSLMILHLSFCTDLEIPQFFCELAQLLKIACSSTLINNILIYSVASILGGIPLSGIIFSYTQIVSSVLRIPSSSGKCKAFSTCGSHLSVVSLFYGTDVGVYISSLFAHSSRKSAVASVMYIVVPQMLNPFIYSLRNKDIRVSLRKLFVRKSSL
ncbi:olfactory receptor 7G2-like [Tenrec ecaudatus]|uniref:olfactory receptor 7G2-like n=1 Tax=Tenrec ecaudatus TaxID=94439 RepID=UPI003F5A16D3